LVTSVPLSPTEKWIVSSSASDPPPALMIHQLNYPWRPDQGKLANNVELTTKIKENRN
jgi:hypothetical protein